MFNMTAAYFFEVVSNRLYSLTSLIDFSLTSLDHATYRTNIILDDKKGVTSGLHRSQGKFRT
jgi:hypothetical protein